jgi:hypothetical protein
MLQTRLLGKEDSRRNLGKKRFCTRCLEGLWGSFGALSCVGLSGTEARQAMRRA